MAFRWRNTADAAQVEAGRRITSYRALACAPQGGRTGRRAGGNTSKQGDLIVHTATPYRQTESAVRCSAAATRKQGGCSVLSDVWKYE
ncbi:uncharacterized protein UDID_18195 [Ustilago sp. UG-2017a]|nr:uncharacterized protein UDID_18195 [Ustilago sp. UG-2017a]